MSIYEIIKKRRLQLGYTLMEVAQQIGVAEATMQRYESGKIKNLKADKIELLAIALKTSPAYLMGWIDDPDPRAPLKYNDKLTSSSGISKETGHYVDHTTPTQLQVLSEYLIKQKDPTLESLVDKLNDLPVGAYEEVEQFLLYVKFKHIIKEGKDD